MTFCRVFSLSEDVEEELVDEPEQDEEYLVEIPVLGAGGDLYVCSDCGSALTWIPYYNRYFCENCGLHY
jgi:hypothetical protein